MTVVPVNKETFMDAIMSIEMRVDKNQEFFMHTLNDTKSNKAETDFISMINGNKEIDKPTKAFIERYYSYINRRYRPKDYNYKTLHDISYNEPLKPHQLVYIITHLANKYDLENCFTTMLFTRTFIISYRDINGNNGILLGYADRFGFTSCINNIKNNTDTIKYKYVNEVIKIPYELTETIVDCIFDHLKNK